MKTAERSLANRSLSEAAIETIDALHQHRLLTTSQLRGMILPGRSPRRMQQVLAELVRRQLADWVAARGQWAGQAERVWFLTKRGSAVVDAVPNKAEPRLRLVSPEQASGRLQSHMLAVNEIGIAFMRAARRARKISTSGPGGMRSRTTSRSEGVVGWSSRTPFSSIGPSHPRTR